MVIAAARAAGLGIKAVAVELGFDAEQRYFDRHVRPLLGADVELIRSQVG